MDSLMIFIQVLQKFRIRDTRSLAEVVSKLQIKRSSTHLGALLTTMTFFLSWENSWNGHQVAGNIRVRQNHVIAPGFLVTMENKLETQQVTLVVLKTVETYCLLVCFPILNWMKSKKCLKPPTSLFKTKLSKASAELWGVSLIATDSASLRLFGGSSTSAGLGDVKLFGANQFKQWLEPMQNSEHADSFWKLLQK